MKKIIVLFCAVVFAFNVNAQKANPVKWSFTAVKKTDKQYELVATATIDASWHIYSQFVKKGPVPTTLQFAKNPLVVLKGSTKEVGNLEKKFDNNSKDYFTFRKNLQLLKVSIGTLILTILSWQILLLINSTKSF
jgi:hypothetical protein